MKLTKLKSSGPLTCMGLEACWKVTGTWGLSSVTCSENQVSKPISFSFYVTIIVTNILVLDIKLVVLGEKSYWDTERYRWGETARLSTGNILWEHFWLNAYRDFRGKGWQCFVGTSFVILNKYLLSYLIFYSNLFVFLMSPSAPKL